MLTGTRRGLNLYCNPFLSRATSTVSFFPLVVAFGQLRVCTGSTLSVVEVGHRPKAIARVGKRVGAVTAQAWLSVEIFLTVINYILIFFLKDTW